MARKKKPEVYESYIAHVTGEYFEALSIGCTNGIKRWAKRNPNGVDLTRSILKRWSKRYGLHHLQYMLTREVSHQFYDAVSRLSIHPSSHELGVLTNEQRDVLTARRKAIYDELLFHAITPWNLKPGPGLTWKRVTH